LTDILLLICKVKMTLFLLGWNLALSLILNDYMKLLLLKKL